jgi:hypothetical protein
MTRACPSASVALMAAVCVAAVLLPDLPKASENGGQRQPRGLEESQATRDTRSRRRPGAPR